jgi:hypothetical protein
MAGISSGPPRNLLVHQGVGLEPLWDELVASCAVHKKHKMPSSRLGIVIRYFTNHQVALGRFLDYGFIPMDNGIVERLDVRTALTRKNYLFAGSDISAERAAIAYMILGSCRLAGIDPLAYLRDVLPRMTRKVRMLDLPQLLPARWGSGSRNCCRIPRAEPPATTTRSHQDGEPGAVHRTLTPRATHTRPSLPGGRSRVTPRR